MRHIKNKMLAILFSCFLIGCNSDSDSPNPNPGIGGDKIETFDPSSFSEHGDVLDNENIIVQSLSGETILEIKKDLTVKGKLTVKDPSSN
ncbi:TPA: hypothetical protein ACX6Q7_001031 [Photobacterium damselae]